ncbi:MAG: NAD-dependent epimerase/dehydratase family protein, partial [Flammeovirgaceae bacterium]
RSKCLTSSLSKSVTYFCSLQISKEELRDLLYSVDEIVYLAYSSVPQTSYLDPVKDINENLTYAVGIFEELKKSNLKKFIYISSGGTVYGQPLTNMIDETHPTNPISPYGITKLAIEKYGLMYFAVNKLPFIIVRPSNPYGEGQFPFKGQGFVSTAIATGLRNEKVKVFGEHGTVRDYIYITDLVKGLLAVIDCGQIGEIYNIGTSIGTSNIQLLKLINGMSDATDLVVNHEVLGSRPFDVRHNVLDSTKLRQLSGWNVSIDISEGLMRTINWVKKILKQSLTNQ